MYNKIYFTIDFVQIWLGRFVWTVTLKWLTSLVTGRLTVTKMFTKVHIFKVCRVVAYSFIRQKR